VARGPDVAPELRVLREAERPLNVRARECQSIPVVGSRMRGRRCPIGRADATRACGRRIMAAFFAPARDGQP